MSKKLVKSTLVFSFMTLISRILGLVRDMVSAHYIGAGANADVFYFSQKIPNFLRRLFAEGSFSQAFVPVLAEYTQNKPLSETQKFIGKVTGTLGLIVFIVTALAIVGSSVVAALFATGWFYDWLYDGPSADKYIQASFLLKITFPYLWFITMVALSGAILNSIGKFGVMSFSPVLLNVAMIFAVIYLSPYTENPNVALAIGVFLGGLLQFLFQIPFLMKEKLLVRPRWGWNDPGVKKIRILMLPAIFAVSVNQINLLLDTFIASFLMTGSVSWLYYSERLFEFPLGMFGIAVSMVILPALSKHYAKKDNLTLNQQAFKHTMDWGVRMVLFIGIPSMIGMILLARPLLIVLFLRGDFTSIDVVATSYSLIALNCGLVSVMLVKVLLNGYYARQDTRTPVKYAVIAMISNMVFNLLAIKFSYIGLAIASAMSSSLNAFLLYKGLQKKEIYQITKKTIKFLIQLIFSSILMGLVIIYLNPSMEEWLHLNMSLKIKKLLVIVLCAIITYMIGLILSGVRKHHFIENS